MKIKKMLIRKSTGRYDVTGMNITNDVEMLVGMEPNSRSFFLRYLCVKKFLELLQRLIN